MSLKIIKGNSPLKIDKHNWVYHDRKGSIDLVHEVWSKGEFVQTDIIRIKRQFLSKILVEKEAGRDGNDSN